MEYDEIESLERQKRREQRAARLRADQMAMLQGSARTLIPDHGIAVPLSRIAVHAGVPRRTAAALVSTTADLAVALVCSALRALIDTAAPCLSDTPADYAARLVRAVHADAAAHRIHWALTCGLPGWQRAEVDAAADFLAFALGAALLELRAGGPGGAGGGGCDLTAARPTGARLLALARAAALGPALPDVQAEGTALAAMLDAALPDAPPAIAPLPELAVPEPAVPQLAVAELAAAEPLEPVPASPADHAAAAPPARAAPPRPAVSHTALPHRAVPAGLAPPAAWPGDDDAPPCRPPPSRWPAPPAHGPPPG